MSSRLEAAASRLATDPSYRDRFRRDPRRAAREHGLDGRELAALCDGRPEALAALGVEAERVFPAVRRGIGALLVSTAPAVAALLLAVSSATSPVAAGCTAGGRRAGLISGLVRARFGRRHALRGIRAAVRSGGLRRRISPSLRRTIRTGDIKRFRTRARNRTTEQPCQPPGGGGGIAAPFDLLTGREI